MAYAGFDKTTQKITFTYPLTVNAQITGASNLTAKTPAYSFSNNSNTGMYSIASNILGFSTNSLERLRIDNSNVAITGKVGINTFAPASYLHVNTTLSSNLPNILALPPIAILEERVASGNYSTASTVNTTTIPVWVTRPLNAVIVDGIGVNLSSSTNTFTLQTGTYYITATAPAIGVLNHRIGLYSTTDSRYIAYGTSEFAGNPSTATTDISSVSKISTVLTFTANKTLRLDHWITKYTAETNKAVTFGIPAAVTLYPAINQNIDEIYARLEITKYQ